MQWQEKHEYRRNMRFLLIIFTWKLWARFCILNYKFITISLFKRRVQISTTIVVCFCSIFYRILTYTSDTCVQNCYTRERRYNIPQKICSVIIWLRLVHTKSIFSPLVIIWLTPLPPKIINCHNLANSPRPPKWWRHLWTTP